MQEGASGSSTQQQAVKYANTVVTNHVRANIKQTNSSNTVDVDHPASSHSEQSSDSLRLSGSICMFPNKPLRKQSRVYEGRYTKGVSGNQKIAVKFIPYDDRNVEEAKALLKLTPHKHVVAFIHSDKYDSGPIEYIFIAMEMCHTESLYERITKATYEPQFNSRLKFTWTSQLVDGMAHIHKNKIIHRDLKPHNVLFSCDRELIKIADFGLSKQLSSDRSVTNQSTLRVGTDGYRAPETYNRDIISLQADIFSLGIVFYFVWSGGEHPFGDEPELWNYNIKCNKDPCFDGLEILEQDRAKNLIRPMLQFEPKKRPTASMLLKHDFFLNCNGYDDPEYSDDNNSYYGADNDKQEVLHKSNLGNEGDERLTSRAVAKKEATDQTRTNVSRSSSSGQLDPPLHQNENGGAGATALNGGATRAKRKKTDHPRYSASQSPSTGLSEPKVRHMENGGPGATGRSPSVKEMNTFLYTITDSISDPDWPRFARKELGLLDGEISMRSDLKHSVEERKIKMLKLWMNQNSRTITEQQKHLERLKDQFHRAPKSTADAVVQTGTVGLSLIPETSTVTANQ